MTLQHNKVLIQIHHLQLYSFINTPFPSLHHSKNILLPPFSSVIQNLYYFKWKGFKSNQRQYCVCDFYSFNMNNRLPRIQISFAKGVCEHVRLGPKISETVKGKLSLGARIVQGGGLQKVFTQIFSVEQGEKLLKVSQCYLSTTAGPIAGLIFISTEKVAFCSERSLTFSTPDGGLVRTPYKVMIPLEKIKRATQSENVNKPSQKYIEIFTVDKFDFWFMGFVSYEKAFKNLQQAISSSQSQ